MSEAVKHDSLAAALLAFQAEAPKLHKGETAKIPTKSGGSYSYKYVDLAAIDEAIKPLLVKHGLVWQTFPTSEDGKPALRYSIKHPASKESDGDVMPLVVADHTAQAHGSGITYARRYAKVAVLDLIADEDDDGAAASVKRPPAPQYASEQQQRLIFGRAKADGIGPQQLANAIRRAANRDELDNEDEATASQQVDFMLKHLPPRLVNPVLEELKKVAEDVPDMVPN